MGKKPSLQINEHKKFRCDKCTQEGLEETERVLLNIFAMMKKFFDHKREDCVTCELSSSNPEEFKTLESCCNKL